MDKPATIFDRDREWEHLLSFLSPASSTDTSGVRLGIVSGRRRQGKTFLLEALARKSGGLYFGATEATEAESLSLFADAVGQHLKTPSPPRLDTWDEAIRYLFTEIGRTNAPVVIDEFPYLSKVSPSLPSIIQREIDRSVSNETSGTLLLCGSAMSVMGRLVSGSAPLRGRTSLELIIRPFTYPLAAKFWNINEPHLAVLHNAVVGGTPAYRRFLDGDVPEDMADFDHWVIRTVLSPATPLFREARYLLDEDADVRDTALYHSVLSSVAHGKTTRGGIAGFVGRKATDISHQLNVLEDAGLLRREPDIFRAGRSTYHIAEPLLTFYQVVMRPQWALLESDRAQMVWQDARPRFLSQVVGPHFEQLCREFAMTAPDGTFPALPGRIGSGVVADPARRSQIQVDVAVLAPAIPSEPQRVLSLGEAKWGEVMDVRHLDRLRRARDLLTTKGYDTRDTVLACYSGAGFSASLQAIAHEDHNVRTFGLSQLYSDL